MNTDVMKRLIVGLALAGTLGLAACGETQMTATPDKAAKSAESADAKQQREYCEHNDWTYEQPTKSNPAGTCKQGPTEEERQAALDAMDEVADEAAEESSDEVVSEDNIEELTEPAKLGDAITLAAGDLRLKATLNQAVSTIPTQLDEYGFGDEPDPGMRFAGVELTMKNVGSKPFDPMWLESALVQRNDTEADEAYMMDTQPWDSMPRRQAAPGQDAPGPPALPGGAVEQARPLPDDHHGRQHVRRVHRGVGPVAMSIDSHGPPQPQEPQVIYVVADSSGATASPSLL